MIGFSTASNMIADGGSAGWAVDGTRVAHPVQHAHLREPRRTCAATALAALLVAGSSVQALAQTAGHVWAGCVLTDDAVTEIEASVDPGAGGIDNPEIAFVVVYSLNNDNDGQPVTGGVTGPVICRNNAVVSAPVPTTQTNDIGSASDTVTVLDGEEAFLLRYQFDDPPQDIEKRVCHTVDSETDCFLIVPAPPID